MSTISTARAAAPAPRLTGGPTTASSMTALDPLRLLRKYKLLLLAAAIFGAGLGALGHVVLMNVYPLYKAETIFQAYALQTAAPNWYKRYIENGSFNPEEALKDLRDDVHARIIGDTTLMTMSMVWKNPKEVAGIVDLAAEAYLEERNRVANSEQSRTRDAVLASLRDIDEQMVKLENDRKYILESQNIEAIEGKYTEATLGMNTTSTDIGDKAQELASIDVMLRDIEDQLKVSNTPTYSDQLRDAIERDPTIGKLKLDIVTLEAQLDAWARNLGPEHRDVKRLQRDLDARREKLESEREKMLEQKFFAMRDAYKLSRDQLMGQIQALEQRLKEFRTRAEQLAPQLAKVADINDQMDRLTTSKADMEKTRNELEAVQSLDTSTRVGVYQRVQIPNEVMFPKWFIMIPLGVIMITGLVGGVAALREVVDQRVKGPADIAVIPRVRVLGIVPHASEDPANPEHPETAFRDQPGGILAESFRQLRANVAKRMAQSAYKTLLVVGGLPESGGTSVACNLAYACAAADQKVLIIDANFRRPQINALMGAAEGPGLGDVLRGKMRLEAALQHTGIQHLDVLTAGAAENRRFESLATDAMAALLKEAAARYDLVIIDVAPSVFGDAIALANRCDASMLVVRAFGEKRGMVARIRNELAETHADFLGVLVNGVRSAAGGYLRGNIRATHNYQAAKA